MHLEEFDRSRIGEGEQIENQLRKVRFGADPVPVMSATIVYYVR
jgi:hypothetical protein